MNFRSRGDLKSRGGPLSYIGGRVGLVDSAGETNKARAVAESNFSFEPGVIPRVTPF